MTVGRLLTITACLLVIGCGSGGTSTSSPDPSPVVSLAGGPPSVVGTVTAGPVCPVETVPPKPECAARPVAGAVIVATDSGGHEVGRATTITDGSYQMVVGQTGSVTISGLPVTGLMGLPEPVTVTLSAPGESKRVDLAYDTGIR